MLLHLPGALIGRTVVVKCMLIPLLYSVLYGRERCSVGPLFVFVAGAETERDGLSPASSLIGTIIHPRPGVIVYVRETRSDPGPSSGTNNNAPDCVLSSSGLKF